MIDVYVSTFETFLSKKLCESVFTLNQSIDQTNSEHILDINFSAIFATFTLSYMLYVHHTSTIMFWVKY